MKKNVMMRLAAVMLMCVLLSTSVIGGTFAKYTTTQTADDTARVAKWGVDLAITGGAFATEYATDDGSVSGTIAKSVVSSTTGAGTINKLVAPGTTGTFTGIDVDGTPEVAVNITTVATVTLTGWAVGDPAEYYCPITVTVNGVDYYGGDYANTDLFAAAIEGAIEAANGNYAPNTDLSGVTGLNGDYTWNWAFVAPTGDTYQTDEKDTMLGNLATAPSITIAVTTTITQID